jgi:hypothetical protein
VNISRSVFDADVATGLALEQDNLVRLRRPARLEETALLLLDPGAKLALDDVAIGQVMRAARERAVRDRCRSPGDGQARQDGVGHCSGSRPSVGTASPNAASDMSTFPASRCSRHQA